jgi:hypothetical protein
MMLQDTRILVTVQIVDDTQALTYAVALATNAIVFVADVIEAVTFTTKVFSIGFKSLAYGLGVTI